MRTSKESIPPAANKENDASFGGFEYQNVFETLDKKKKSEKKSNVYFVVSAIGIVSAVLLVVMALVTVGSSMM